MRRRGFTLVELIVSLVVTGLVAGVALRLFLRLHWSGEADSQRAALQATLRTAALYLSSELKESGGTAGDPDLLAFAPESLTWRAMRSTGTGCALSSGILTVPLADLAGYRLPQVGRDSILILATGPTPDPADDQWLHLTLVSTGSGSCLGEPALLLGTVLDTMMTPLRWFPLRPPFRTFEIMQARLYQSGGDYWLGARSVSAGETIQPLAGPLTAQGLSLAGSDSLDQPTAAPAAVRRIAIRLRGWTAGSVRTGAGMGPAQRRSDSLATSVLLRNW